MYKKCERKYYIGGITAGNMIRFITKSQEFLLGAAGIPVHGAPCYYVQRQSIRIMQIH